MIETNSIGSAGALLDEIRNAIYLVQDGSERSNVRDQYYSSKKRFDYFGDVFDYDGLYDLQDRATRLGESTNELKLIVFWSLQSHISGELIEQIEQLKADFKKRRVKVIAVCKTEDDAARQELGRIASENTSIEFCQLKENDRSSKLFVERFPIRKYPYLLMLSANHQVVGINVDPVFSTPSGDERKSRPAFAGRQMDPIDTSCVSFLAPHLWIHRSSTLIIYTCFDNFVSSFAANFSRFEEI